MTSVLRCDMVRWVAAIGILSLWISDGLAQHAGVPLPKEKRGAVKFEVFEEKDGALEFLVTLDEKLLGAQIKDFALRADQPAEVKPRRALEFSVATRRSAEGKLHARFVLERQLAQAARAELALGLWLFYRSHKDLGTNWSISLEVRETHQLITHGIYRWVRHPMYLALLTYSVGQALVVPNWLVGPSYGVAMLLLFALRVGPEEHMMLDEFGKDYQAYMATTRRLIPGIW